MILCLVLASPAARTASADPAEETRPVSFQRDIAPLLQRRCLNCHNEDSAKGGYRMHTFEHLLQPGDSELAPVVAGKIGESELVHLLREPDENARMPQKADPLPQGEMQLIERWITEGALYDGGARDRLLVELTRETLLHPAPVYYARPSPVTALAFSPDGKQLAVSGYFEVTLWDIADNALVRRIGGLPERITSLVWDCTSHLLVVAGGSPGQWGTVAVVDPSAEFQVRFLCDLPEVITSVATAGKRPILAAASGDRTVRFFDLASGKPTRILRHHADWVQAVALSADGDYAASASRDRTVKVFDTRTGELEASYSGHATPILGVAFSSDGAHVYSVGRDKTVHRWKRQGAQLEGNPFRFPSEIQCLAVVDDRVVTGASDTVVRISQSSDQQTLFALHGHRDVVQAVAISDDRALIATGSHGGEVCIWETSCGTWLHRFIASPMGRAR